MSDRLFNIVHPHGQRSGQRITCGEPGCVAEDFVPKTTGRAMPPEAVANIFRRRGWHVGTGPRKDRCPDHNPHKRKLLKPSIEETPMGLQKDSSVVELRPAHSGASEQPPRQMGREDRRLIFAKLEEVYLDERVGYSPGWNDERVAKDMAVPRAWVETIRDENFGPQRAEQSAEVIDIRDRILSFEAEQTTLVLDAAELRKTAARIVTEAGNIVTRSSELATKMEALKADLRKLTGGR